MRKINREAKITFGDTVTYRDVNLRDYVGLVIADDKRSSKSSKLWLVRWNKPVENSWNGKGLVGVEHEANLARVDNV